MKTNTILNQTKFHNIVFFLFILSLAFSNIAKVMAQKKQSIKNRTTIIFIDKSTSTEADDFIKQKNEQWLKKVVKQNALNDGDKIIVSFIFENTSNIANKIECIYHPPKPKTGHMSTSEARIAKVKFAKRLRTYKKSFTNKILVKSFGLVSKSTSTDIVGSVKLLADISAKNSSQFIKVYYFSDMQECSAFKHLSCGHPKSSVISFDHAKSLAQQDVKRLLTRYQLSDNCLKNIAEISVIVPSKELDTNAAFAILPEYWNYIFYELGASNINYH